MKRLIAIPMLAVAAQAGAQCVPSHKVADKSSWQCVQGHDDDSSVQNAPIVIHDSAAWRRFCAERRMAPLAVDFSKEIVVGVVVRTGGAGWSVDLGVPQVDGGKTSIEYRLVPPSGGTMGTAVMGGAFAVMRMAKPADGSSVVIREERGRGSVGQRPSGPSAGVVQAGQRVDRAVAAAGSFGSSAAEWDGQPQATAMGSASGGQAGGLKDAIADDGSPKLPAGVHLALFQASCTPGVDCPSATPQRKPTQPAPSCTPGVDCPSNPPRRNCTPGVDCPGDGNNGNNGRTPLPPNYRPRPSDPPGRFPPIGNPNYDDNAVVSGWFTYRDFLGAHESYGSWQRNVGRGVVERGGREVGSQSSAYTLHLQSDSSRRVYRLYWRYVGVNCDPNDASRCLDWSVQYAWFFDRWESGRSASIRVEVRFRNDQELLPWEKERLALTYDGGQVGLETGEAAFQYSVRGPMIDQQTGTAFVELTPTSRLRHRPEKDKVALSLVKGGPGLQLVVDDARDAFYAGEPLEIVVEIKMDSGHWYSRDKVAFERKYNGPIHLKTEAGKHPQAVVDVPSQGSGKYYINKWSFRRPQSQISTGDWIDRGNGNAVTL